MSIKLVWRTDVHMSDQAPSSRKDDWVDTVLGKLSQVRDVASRVKAHAILDGGDFFHIKSPTRNSHETVRRVAEHHLAYPCPVFCTPGNHDSVYGNYAFLGQQPLGVLYGSGVFKRLYDEHEAIFEESTLKVRVVGIPYHGPRYEMDRFHRITRGDEDVLICVAHVLASDKGGKMFEGEDIVRYSDLLDTEPDIYCFGHWHKDQGVEGLSGPKGDKLFVNIGSLTRGSLSEDDVQRRPACAVISVDGPRKFSVETIRLEVSPPEEVFDIEGRARQVRRQVEMDQFVERIRDALQPLEEDVGIIASVQSMSDIPEDVRERALAYLEKAEP